MRILSRAVVVDEQPFLSGDHQLMRPLHQDLYASQLKDEELVLLLQLQPCPPQRVAAYKEKNKTKNENLLCRQFLSQGSYNFDNLFYFANNSDEIVHHLC